MIFVQRTRSFSAQASFDLVQRLQRLTKSSGPGLGLVIRLVSRLARPIAKKLGSGHTITAHVYGHDLVMPAEHPLPRILNELPQYNRPLALAAEAIAKNTPDDAPLVIIDVGANIGDTVAIVEQRIPTRSSYLCIEPEPDMAELCRSNHLASKNVQVEQAFIGEQEGAIVWLRDDGRANPSTTEEPGRPSDQPASEGRLRRLDGVALPFAKLYGKLSLIKVDTEGYDFSVLRSGSELLKQFQPAIFLEWYPELLHRKQEQVWEGLEFLQSLGYRHFVFYTNAGDYYCKVCDPDRQFLRSLASVTNTRASLPYFDVFASTSESVHNQLVELSIHEAQA